MKGRQTRGVTKGNKVHLCRGKINLRADTSEAFSKCLTRTEIFPNQPKTEKEKENPNLHNTMTAANSLTLYVEGSAKLCSV